MSYLADALNLSQSNINRSQPVNYNINQAQVDMAGQMNKGFTTAENMAGAPLRQQANELALQQGQQNFDQQAVQNTQQNDEATQRSVVDAAASIQNLPPEQQIVKLNERKTQLEAEGRDASHTISAIESIANDPVAFNELNEQTVAFGEKKGWLKAKASEARLPTGRFTYQKLADGTLLKTDTSTGDENIVEASVAAAEQKQEILKEEKEQKQAKIDAEIENKKQQLSEKKQKQTDAVIAKQKGARSVVTAAEDNLVLLDRIVDHPGFENYVGAQSLFGGNVGGLFEEPVAGSDAAGAKALIDQIDAKGFLASISDFKAAGGAGALSDSEGKKLGAAFQALQASQNEKDFKINVKVVKGLMKRAINNTTTEISRYDKQLKNLTNGVKVEAAVDVASMSDEDLFN